MLYGDDVGTPWGTMGGLGVPVSGSVFTVGMPRFGPVETLRLLVRSLSSAAAAATLVDSTEISSAGGPCSNLLIVIIVHCFLCQ